jgi:hypothetical protein
MRIAATSAWTDIRDHYFVAAARGGHIYGGEQNAIFRESVIRTSFVLERFQNLTGSLLSEEFGRFIVST